MREHRFEHGVCYNAKAEDVYPLIDRGSISMVWSDGPYAMGKGDWDKMKPSELPDFYEPHIMAWSELCAPSATIYHWGTAEGEGYVRDVYRRHGWAFHALLIWHKPDAPSMIGINCGSGLVETAEYCGVWVRGGASPSPSAGGNVWARPLSASRHETLTTGAKVRSKMKKNGLYSFVSERLHPCQKPIVFSQRAVLASADAGETILDPFAGTMRTAAACAKLSGTAEVRRHISIEMDSAYFDAAIADVEKIGSQLNLL